MASEQQVDGASLVEDVDRACREDDAATLRALLSRGARLDIKNSDGWLPIHEATYCGSNNCLQVILDTMKQDNDTIGVDVLTPDHVTSLMLACQECSEPCIQTLLKHGASTSLCNNRGYSALHFVLEHDDIGLVRLLLEHGGTRREGANNIGEPSNLNMNEQDCSLLLHAIQSQCSYETISVLIQHGASTMLWDQYVYTPLAAAVEHNRLDVVRLMTVNGLTPHIVNSSHWNVPTESMFTLLDLLTYSDNYGGPLENNDKAQMLELLLDIGLNITEDILKVSLRNIFSFGDVNMLSLVLSKKLPSLFSWKCREVLWQILLSGSVSMFETLASHGFYSMQHSGDSVNVTAVEQTVFGLFLVRLSSTMDLLRTLRMLTHSEFCPNIMLDPLSWFRSESIAGIEQYDLWGLLREQSPVVSFPRRLWGVLTKFYERMECDVDPDVWMHILDEYIDWSDIGKAVFGVFIATQILFDFPYGVMTSLCRKQKQLRDLADEVLSFGGIPPTVRLFKPEERCKNMLRIALLQNPSICFFQTWHPEEYAILADAVNAVRPASLLALSRQTVIDELRHTAYLNETSRPKVRDLIIKLSQSLPPRLESILLFGTPELIETIDAIFDTSPESSWVSAFPSSEEDGDILGDIPAEMRHIYEPLLKQLSRWDQISTVSANWTL